MASKSQVCFAWFSCKQSHLLLWFCSHWVTDRNKLQLEETLSHSDKPHPLLPLQEHSIHPLPSNYQKEFTKVERLNVRKKRILLGKKTMWLETWEVCVCRVCVVCVCVWLFTKWFYNVSVYIMSTRTALGNVSWLFIQARRCIIRRVLLKELSLLKGSELIF